MDPVSLASILVVCQLVYWSLKIVHAVVLIIKLI